MKTRRGRVVSVHAESDTGLGKKPCPTILVELDGIVGDRHRGYQRQTWPGDKQPLGTLRRNERQWSAVSLEELDSIRAAMGLSAPLDAADLGANLCTSGLEDLSRLPRGSILRFPSGATLMVEEYNPPCRDMSVSLAKKYQRSSGEPVTRTAFSIAAKWTRGIVGVVETAGPISVGDEVVVQVT